MKVFSLVGKSGTGKSYNAIRLCRELNTQYIIDDGLFIGEASILAGKSAKREATKVGAIKTALFSDDGHRDAVVAKIAEVSPDRILVIGTSEKMVEKITERLGIPHPDQVIHIEDITTEGDRNAAERQRSEQGQHVIPVPTMQLKREFSGYFVHPLKVLRAIPGRNATGNERSVVRPTYSYLGAYTVSDGVIGDIVEYIGEKDPGVADITQVFSAKSENGITINVELIMKYGSDIFAAAERTQKEIYEQVEAMTSFTLDAVNMEIKGLRR